MMSTYKELLASIESFTFLSGPNIGGGTMEVVGALAPILRQLCGQCPNSKFNGNIIDINKLVIPVSSQSPV